MNGSEACRAFLHHYYHCRTCNGWRSARIALAIFRERKRRFFFFIISTYMLWGRGEEEKGEIVSFSRIKIFLEYLADLARYTKPPGSQSQI